MSNNIYLAAKYSRMAEMRNTIAPLLIDDGHEITSRWIYGEEGKFTEQAGAEMDIGDIERSNCLLFFSHPFGSLNVGGGRHWEFGYAYCLWMRTNHLMNKIIVVGEQEHAFCHLSRVLVCPGIEAARSLLKA